MLTSLLLILATGQIILDQPGSLEVDEHHPVVIQAELEIDEGWQVLFTWDIDKPARSREVNNGKTLHVWAPPGTYEVELEAILINWDTRQLRKEEQVTLLTVRGEDPTPPTPPGPTPPGPGPPTDEFDNVAQAIATKGRELGLSLFKGEIASNYRQVAGRLEGSQDPLLATITDAGVEIKRLNNQFLDSNPTEKEKYRQLATVIAPRWDGAWPRETVVRFFRAIADGLDSI